MPAKVKCPNCRKETTWENNLNRPFCSERCQLIDLGAWTQERYRIPSDDVDFGLGDEDEENKKQ